MISFEISGLSSDLWWFMIPQDHCFVIPRPSKSGDLWSHKITIWWYQDPSKSVFFEVSSSNVVDIVLKCRPQMSSVHWSSWQTLNPKPLVYKPQISNEIVNLILFITINLDFYKHYYLVYDFIWNLWFMIWFMISFEISGLWFHLKSLVYHLICGDLWSHKITVLWYLDPLKVVIYDPTRSPFGDTKTL